MAPVRASVTIDAPPDQVWADVQDISTHVTWMLDAEAIRFTSDQRSGLGTTFDCDTKVGPIRLVDRMSITEWVPGQTMGVRHEGLVTGTGAFTLRDLGQSTEFIWVEDLIFPWWMGGPIGAKVGSAVMSRIWKRNLRALKARIESGAG